MTVVADIAKYHESLSPEDRELCEALAEIIERELPQAEGKVWHRHPVWFVDGNPLVGYHRLKPGVRVLFWSGQSFPTPGLIASGSFQAAEYWPLSVSALTDAPLKIWLAESVAIQWDYEHIVKNRGLVRRTAF